MKLQIAGWKKRLKRILVLNSEVRFTEAGKLASLVLSFQWTLNACNVFVVDKQLMAGVRLEKLMKYDVTVTHVFKNYATLLCT